MSRILLCAMLALMFAGAAFAQRPPPEPSPLPVGLSTGEVAVTSDFRGAAVTIFGVNPPENRGGEIIIVLRGPDRPATVMRKSRVLGLWVNRDPVRFSAAPGFFAVYSTQPVGQLLDRNQIWRLKLDPASLAALAGRTPADADPGDYRRALVDLRTEAGLYRVNPQGVSVRDGLLFRADFAIPANAPLGAYQAEIFVVRNGIVISREDSAVTVDRRGLERSVYQLATQNGFFYGLLCVAMALLAGLAAAYAFRRS
jgi:uncharacterized protein (TIGR02186 family)